MVSITDGIAEVDGGKEVLGGVDISYRQLGKDMAFAAESALPDFQMHSSKAIARAKKNGEHFWSVEGREREQDVELISNRGGFICCRVGPTRCPDACHQGYSQSSKGLKRIGHSS